MTVRKFGMGEMSRGKDVNIWKYETCCEFHVKAGDVLLTFTPQEFAEFVNDSWNCYYKKEFELALTN